jgi:hypothetical protein
MKTKVLKRGIPLWVLIVALTCVGIVVYSVVQFTREISNIMTVRADYSIDVLNEDKTALVTPIDWGEFASPNEAKVTILWVKNVGNTELRYSWNVVDFPNQQFSISNAYFEDGPNQWVELNQNEVCPTVLMTPGYELKINFTLTYTGSSAGSYGFTLNIMSNNS